jgi:signal transduction histidine kinase
LLVRAIRYSIHRLASEQELERTQLLLIQAEKLRSLGQMAASVAHEVKNPLAILHMGIECMGEFFFNGDEQMVTVVTEMKRAIRRAEAIIRDMLDYSSARKLELAEVCVNSLIDQTLAFVRHEFVRARVRVVTNYTDGPTRCRVDAPKIEQVFINILTNACQAMPDGGDLTITTTEIVIEQDDPEAERDDVESVRFRRGDKVLVVDIRDTGTGIPEDKLDKIFEPFFTTKGPGEGTGLGLMVVKKIIDLHEGKIAIANAEGGGAQVTIALKSIPKG